MDAEPKGCEYLFKTYEQLKNLIGAHFQLHVELLFLRVESLSIPDGKWLIDLNRFPVPAPCLIELTRVQKTYLVKTFNQIILR